MTYVLAIDPNYRKSSRLQMCKDTKNAQKNEILIYPKASAYNLPCILFTDHYKEYQQNLAVVLQILRNWVAPMVKGLLAGI